MVNIYYDYTEESLFVPGVTDQAIVPQLYGTGFNYVSKRRAQAVVLLLWRECHVREDFQ